MKVLKSTLILSQGKVINGGKEIKIELGRVEFQNQDIAKANAIQSQAMRDIWTAVRKIAAESEIEVIVEHTHEEQSPEEKKKTLNLSRQAAIKQFKLFYQSYGFGSYIVTSKDAQITAKQCALVLNEVQLRKYFETTHWKLKDKFLSVYCAADTQNILNQKEVVLALNMPNDWQIEHYKKLNPENQRAYIQHLKSLGFEKKSVESGVLTYVKPKKQN